MKYFITGGAGFIGSHIVDVLIQKGHEVTVYDNLSTGREEFVQHHAKNKKFKLIKADVLDKKKLNLAMKGSDFVFHLAAHADVRSGLNDHDIDHVQNLEATQAVLEAMYVNDVKKIAFSSTSSVYGDATVHPTPESAEHNPTSLYGATKSACEAYIKAYAAYYGWKVYIFRFVSFVGERYTHGIIYDVLKKLEKNPKSLELLSDGTPKKSSVYVKDGVAAILKGIQTSKEQFNVFNIGHDDVLTVDKIVDQILTSAGISIKKKYLGGKKGWKGDNTYVHLSNQKLKAAGWEPKHSFEEGIDKTVKYLMDNPSILKS